jgi:hypothetical protein
MKISFGAFVTTLFIIFLVVVGWKQRNTIPLYRGNTGDHLPEALVGVGILVGIVALYVRWANRRDFK